jgi:hypothetical protein
MQEAFAAGIDSFIMKPFTLKDFLTIFSDFKKGTKKILENG